MKALPLLAVSLVLAAGATACSSGGGANGSAGFAPLMPALSCQRATGPNGVTPLDLAKVHGWMSPGVKKKTSLLYVSDEGAGSVDIFSVPGYKLEGQITSGIDQPEGIATDEKGRLYVPNLRADTVTVYKQGDTSPFLTLSDSNCPEAVAVAKDGYVFVGDYYGAGVEVYKPGKTSPSTRLTNPNIKELFAVGVDLADNVYAAGWGPQYSYSPVIIEYTPSGNAINLDLTGISYPSGVLVDDKDDIVETDFWKAEINIFAPGDKSPTSTISTPTEPDRSALNKEENLLYVPTGQGDKVWAVDYPQGTSGKDIDISGFAAGAATIPAPKP